MRRQHGRGGNRGNAGSGQRRRAGLLAQGEATRRRQMLERSLSPGDFDIPSMQNRGSVSALNTDHPSAGARNHARLGLATRIAIGRPINVQRTMVAAAQRTTFPIWAIRPFYQRITFRPINFR